MKKLAIAIVSLMIGASAYAQGTSANSPGSQKPQGQSAKEYSPGQTKQSGQSAKSYAPGKDNKGQTKPDNKNKSKSKN